MGYDVHITRAKEWLNSKRTPIMDSEWSALVSADATLEVDKQSYSGRDSEDGTSKRQHPVMWLAYTDPQGDHPNFWYEDGRIFRKNPDDLTLKKMIEIAHKLNARVLGDEEEAYTTIKGELQVRAWTAPSFLSRCQLIRLLAKGYDAVKKAGSICSRPFANCPKITSHGRIF